MPLSWVTCFLCDGYGRLDVGENYNQFFEVKNIKCPCCNGKGKLAINTQQDSFWNKQREDYL